jgi:hypothetical protein
MREWAGVDPSNGTGMWYMYYDDKNDNNLFDTGDVKIASYEEYLSLNPTAIVEKTTTKAYADASLSYIGKSAIPKVRGAFRLSGTFKNFDISTQLLYSWGGYSVDYAYAQLMNNSQVGNNNFHIDIRDRWQFPGDITDVPRLSDNYDTNVSSTSTRFLTKSDFLSLNNVMVGYTMPKKYSQELGLANVNIWLSADNLFLFTSRKGFNPTTSETGSTDTYTYSPLTTFTMGVRVKL